MQNNENNSPNLYKFTTPRERLLKFSTMIKPSAIFVFFILICCAVSGCTSNVAGKVPVGKLAPYTNVTLMNGETVPIEQFKGKTTVLLFWAQWCTHSGPVMAELNEYLQGLNHRKDVKFLAISVDKNEDLPKLQERIKYQSMDGFQHCFSGNAEYDQAFMAFGTGELPLIVVIDPKGVIVAEGSDPQIVKDYFTSIGYIPRALPPKPASTTRSVGE